LLIGVVFVGSCFFFGLRWFERAVTFHPVRYHSEAPWPLPKGAQDVWFTTADGVRLHGWFFQDRSRTPVATVIFFHGNGGNISDVDWVGEELTSSGVDVLLFDYRGYGRSDGEVDDEHALYADADAAYQFLKASGVEAESIVLYGQSLGTAAAVDLASRERVAAVILESGLSSASEMAREVLPWLPRQLHFITRNRFESARKLSQVKYPVLITHGEPDHTISSNHARALFAAANEPKKLMIFPGAGHNVFGSLGKEYLKVVSAFISESITMQKG
jgi:fermentation-respiration switch protein FrsA (DUF1100 family)